MKKEKFKKTIISLALGGVMVASPLALVGCGADGKDGATGKSAYDLAVENGFNGTLQEWLESLKGDSGTNSYTHIMYATNNKGADMSPIYATGYNFVGFAVTDSQTAPTDASVYTWAMLSYEQYVGYDGYYWEGIVRTSRKAINTLGNYISENTLGLVGNKYFETYEINLKNDKIVLMNNYVSSASKTGYSGVGIKKLEIQVNSTGKLQIATAKVSDIVGRNGTNDITLSNQVSYNVVPGLNVIDFTNYVVPEDSTIVLSSVDETNDVTISATRGIGQEDQQGYFANLSDTSLYAQSSNTGLYGQSFKTKDRIPFRITVDEIWSATRCLTMCDNKPVTEYITNGFEVTATPTEGKKFAFAGLDPSVRTVVEIYENKVIENIRIVLPQNPSQTNGQYMTVFRVNSEGDTLQEYKFYAKESDLISIAEETEDVNRIVTLYRKPEDIASEGALICKDGESLMFWQLGDPLAFGFATAVSAYSDFREYYSNDLKETSHSAYSMRPSGSMIMLGIDVIVRDILTFNQHIAILRG